LLKQAGKAEKKPLRPMAENFTKKSVVKEAKKSLRNEVQNSTVKSVAKAALSAPSNTKVRQKLQAKLVLKKQVIEVDRESDV
jgi:ribosomal protein S20